jgi:predicted metal-dependent hydrolase
MPAISNFTSPIVSSDLVFQGGETSAALQLTVSPRARKLRLKVDPRTGAVQLTVPRRVSQRKALEWAAGHRDWIETQLARVTPPERIVPGGAVPIYGRPHLVDWSPERSRIVRFEDGQILAGGPLEGLEGRILRWLKRHALDVLARETAEYAEAAGVTVTRIAVGDPLSRWGSCSSTGAIRYSWRLIMAPDHVRRATVAHEVAHRIHMHHGPEFHALVEQLYEADPKPARHWLRTHGATLHRIART